MSVIRSAGLRGFRAAVAELGGNADEFAALAGLPAAALDADDLLVSDQAVATVLEIAADRLGCPDLGLRIGARQDLGMLGPLALAIRTSPTLADALECTSRYLFVHARSLSLTLEPDPDGDPRLIALHYGVPPPPPVQGTDLGLAFLHRAIQRLVDGPYALRSVDLPYRPPAPAEVYEEFFGAPVRFERPGALLRVPRTLAAHTLAGGDETLRRLAMAFLAEQSADAGASIVPRVSAAVRQLLGTTAPEIAAVARLLALHPRTLQRRLAAAGTSFAGILDEVRRSEARRYLTSTDLPMSQVASLIGLSEQSTFTRCCRRWWGVTPSTVRRDPSRVRT
ncbi:AraC family transcriptional regulator [Nocardia sp. CDC159]|uniref:AraC family transcriptional regulator n=1 Tax=Nocardia pulmonis TaxID=2951408 RepID=A0A9X2EH57_9NOCA|nr:MULTISPECIES: AraC family transcriptional regulator [Nocardia]MCM6778123.1 AraC family transcriptional regulator [Nocardia pulmonis]MCM6791012.1 AraC family transcriptional regulator [Nocardia sp. CDC159]